LSRENIQPGRRRGINARKATWTGTLARVSVSVRRGRRPQARLENFMHENRETSEMPAENVSRRSAGEGSGHTARVYVSEESHRCIVPMNHSNKDGTFVGGE